MGATLADLPAELVCTLISLLDNRDALAFRGTSRQIERSTFETFARRFFRKKGFLISPLSLHVLQQIAEHAHLSRYVQHVWFNPDYFTFTDFEVASSTQHDDVLDRAATSKVLLDDQSFQAYSRGLEDHHELMTPNRLTPVLCEAFRRFTNLQTVGMRRSESYAAYGWSFLEQNIGHDPRVIGQSFHYPPCTISRPGRLYIAILQALAQADRHIQRLYTDAVELDNINPSFLPAEVVRAACAHLRYLEMNIFSRNAIGLSWEERRAFHQPLEDGEASERLWVLGKPGQGLLQVLKSAPSLQEVALQVLPTLSWERDETRLALRASGAHYMLKAIASGVKLSNLQRVKIERFTTDGPQLWSFLESSADKLTSLKLREVCLAGSDDDPRPWQVVFEMLATRCPQLLSILFHDLLREVNVLDRDSVVLFEPPGSSPEPANEEDGSDHDSLPGMHRTLVEATGRDQVATTLASISQRHWYHRLSLRIAELDEEWHTDTSDEDW